MIRDSAPLNGPETVGTPPKAKFGRCVVSKKVSPLNPSFIPRGMGVLTAAQYLGVTSSFIRSQIWSGALPAMMLGKRHIIDRVDLDSFLERQKKEAA
jgi:excisionase family DNA binding protein